MLGPLALQSEPGNYDLCREHADGLSAPLGWEVIRLPVDDSAEERRADDLHALAEAVREVGFRPPRPQRTPEPVLEGRRKGHLIVVPDEDR